MLQETPSSIRGSQQSWKEEEYRLAEPAWLHLVGRGVELLEEV